MKFKEVVHTADKLAFDNQIGRVTLNIVEHPKTHKVHIVEELCRYDTQGREIKQRFQTHIDLNLGKINVDAEVDYLKTKATYRFLGREVPAIEDLCEYCLLPSEVSKAEVAQVHPIKKETALPNVPIEKETTEATPAVKASEVKKNEIEETKEDKPESVANTTEAKKPAEKKKPRKQVRKPKTVKNIKFDRAVQLHLATLGKIVREELGEDWKQNSTYTSVVKDLLLNHLHQKFDLFGKDEDKPLPEFDKFVRDKLLALKKTEDRGLAGI